MTRMITAGLLLIGFAITPAFAQDQPAAERAAASMASPVNINTATMEQLETLPGIGPATAERIVEYRQKNGGFKKIEELMNIRGVGEKSFLQLKELITVAAPRAERAPQRE